MDDYQAYSYVDLGKQLSVAPLAANPSPVAGPESVRMERQCFLFAEIRLE